jgi:hypothetical protein
MVFFYLFNKHLLKTTNIDHKLLQDQSPQLPFGSNSRSRATCSQIFSRFGV